MEIDEIDNHANDDPKDPDEDDCHRLLGDQVVPGVSEVRLVDPGAVREVMAVIEGLGVALK